MILKFIITNSGPESVEFDLLGPMWNAEKPPYGIPPGVSITIECNQLNKDQTIAPYHEFLTHALVAPLVVKVVSTTDNRQLEFYHSTVKEKYKPISPRIPPSPLEFPKEYEWDPSAHNIADTHESFTINTTPIIKMKLLGNQVFELVLAVESMMVTNSPLFPNAQFSPKPTAEQVFDKAAEATMVEWDLPAFRKEYPTLLKTILLAMKQYKRK